MDKKGLRYVFSLGLGGVLFLMCTLPLKAQYAYKNTPLSDIISDIQHKTPYRFLYRESLVADIELTLHANEQQLFPKLKSQLYSRKIAVKIDRSQKQIILFRTTKKPEKKSQLIAGQIVDANTGERLPLATVSWYEGKKLRGVVSNSAGAFSISRSLPSAPLVFTASYIGYAPKSIELDLSSTSVIRDLSFRLQPKFIGGNEIVVTGSNYYVPIDSSLKKYVDIGIYSPLGETNTIRGLQALPSVGLSTTLSEGIHVRGSSSDGLQVLLDDITIFNQSHLFGLLDSFNADALQRNGFFYDITPAQYQAPPGGTLALITRTGSLNTIKATGGVSNSAYRLTLEGPLKKGTSSWLISGRNSYLNDVDWLNNSKLIEWGLDVNRPKQILDEHPDKKSSLIRPLNSYAHFFDLHSKIYMEGRAGDRFILSSYLGGDNTRQEASRLVRSFNSDTANNFKSQPVSTKNIWGNVAASAQYQRPLSDELYSYSTAGLSIYNTRFLKNDFTYTRINPESNNLQVFTFPFENKSILNEIKAEQRFDLSLSPLLLTIGGSWQYYLGQYYEESFERLGFFSSTSSHKADVYTQFDFPIFDASIDVSTGGRLTYYSAGNYLKFSPRLKFKIFPQSDFSLGAGYSRNYQFLNEIDFTNAVSSDVWILSDGKKPPVSVDYFTAGAYLKASEYIYFQAEGYIKESENLRLHEINSFSLSNTFKTSPFVFNNKGHGEGIEFLLRNSFNYFNLTQTFTLSRLRMQNPDINDGKPFTPGWDRKYKYVTTLEAPPSQAFAVCFIPVCYRRSQQTCNLWLTRAATAGRLPSYRSYLRIPKEIFLCPANDFRFPGKPF